MGQGRFEKLAAQAQIQAKEFLTMAQRTEVIETTVAEIAAELARRGLDPQDRVTVTIQTDQLIPGRREARLRVVAAGLSDDDIDRLIDEARTEAQPLIR